MFYYLLFAHLLADYPLQPNWVASNKSRRGVLFLHALTHFLTSILIVWIFKSTTGLPIWPYLLLLVVIHFLIDSGKNYLSQIHSNWVKAPYWIDQLLHVVTIMIISILIQNQSGLLAFPSDPGWVVLAIAYLFVTYIWFISERVMTHDEPIYRQSVINDSWSRMLFRAVFLTGFLGLWLWAGKSLFMTASSLYIPYQARQFGRRALITDIAVTLGVFVLLVMIPETPF